MEGGPTQQQYKAASNNSKPPGQYQQQYQPVNRHAEGPPRGGYRQAQPGYLGMIHPGVMHVQMPAGMQLPSLMTPQQKEEQYQAIHDKLTLKPSLTETCQKHASLLIIFERKNASGSLQKYCEKCYAEQEERNKDPNTAIQVEETKEEIEQLIQRPAAQQQTILDKNQRIQQLQEQLQSLLNSLSAKMQKKVEDLNLRYQQLSFYESTLTEKFQPIFQIMRQTVRERELDYMTYMLKQLHQNKDRVATEKVTLEKLMSSYGKMADDIKRNLEEQLHNIELQDKESKKLVEREQAGEDSEVSKEAEALSEAPPKVNTYQIEALSTMIDDYENIITKNYCLYSNCEDFTFAQTRSKQQLETQFKEFVDQNFSGDYQIKDWFIQEVLPRVIVLQWNTKFIYTFKILHNNSECQMIQNAYQFADRCRHIITPEGQVFITGGFQSALKLFLDNTFILDDHRATLVPLQRMKQSRADHAILYNQGQIYVFGGMSLRQNSQKLVQTISSCEVYSIQDDIWTELPPMTHPRQSFGVVLFNDKYIFAFGGKNLKDSATIQTLSHQPFDFVNSVEVFEIDKAVWKSINYISESNKLRLINPGVYQVTGKRIIIFGGAKPIEEDDSQKQLECGQKVTLSNETLFFNVTDGEIKRGPDMSKPSYYISGGNIFPQQGKIHAFGFTTAKDHPIGIQGLSATPVEQSGHMELNPALNKKSYNYYKVTEEEWHDVHENIFTGQRKMSLDTLDETF